MTCIKSAQGHIRTAPFPFFQKRLNSARDELFARATEQWETGRLRSAFQLFLSGAKQGDPDAQHNLAYFYDIGVGIKPNRVAAIFWYRRAYKQGSRIAAANIATIFRDEGNRAGALAWYKRAANMGDGDACLDVAKIYLVNDRTKKKAIPYLEHAVTLRSEDLTDAAREEVIKLLAEYGRMETSGCGLGGTGKGGRLSCTP